MKEIIILTLLLCAIFTVADARKKIGHALGKCMRLKSQKVLSDLPRRLKLPRFLESKSKGFFDTLASVGTAALQNTLAAPQYGAQYQKPYPVGYPQGYPQGYTADYPQGYTAGYPQGYPAGYPQQNLIEYPQQNTVANTPMKTEVITPIEGVNATSVPGPNLTELEQDQNEARKKLEKDEKEADKLRLALDQLRSSMGVNAKKGVQIEADVITPAEVEEAESMKAFEEAAIPKNQFTAPVIVLLPPETTPRDKLEFARALGCRGKGKIGENVKLTEMASIKGRTKKELENEIEQTEKKLDIAKKDRKAIHATLRKIETQAIEGADVKSDLRFIEDDLRDKDKEIETLIRKLEAMEKRKDALNLKMQIENKKEKKELETSEKEEADESQNKGKKGSKFLNFFKKKHKKKKNDDFEEE